MEKKPRRHGFPAKYVLVKTWILPEDRDYLDRLKTFHALESRSAAGRLVVENARRLSLFLPPRTDATIASE